MRNVFIQTANAKRFINAMREAEKLPGEPVFMAFHGPAGRGKTDTARYFAAKDRWTYCRCVKGWQNSELWMLQDLCVELKVDPIPGRKKPAFEAILAALRRTPRPVLIDDADKMPEGLLEWIRDFIDLTTVPFALLGEKRLKTKMQKRRRIWSRTLRLIEFEPISTRDIIFFCKEATSVPNQTDGLLLNANQADMMGQVVGGDFRPVKRQVFFIEELARVNNTRVVTDEMVKTAISKERKEVRVR